MSEVTARQTPLSDIAHIREAIEAGNLHGAHDRLATILRSAKPAGAPDDNYLGLVLLFAETQRRLGNFDEAYANFSVYRRFRPAHLPEPALASIRHCLVRMRTVTGHPDVEHDVVEFIHDDATNSHLMDGITCTLLVDKYRLNDPTHNVELQTLLDDPLMLVGLQSLVLANREVEVFLTGLRRALLTLAMTEGYNDALTPLVSALAIHAFGNEYICSISADEAAVLEGLKRTVSAWFADTAVGIEGVSHLLQLLAMYEPLSELAEARRLSRFDPEDWPRGLQDAARCSLYEPARERTIARAIESLSDPSDAVSRRVRQQYEANPYPRWQTVSRPAQKVGYLDHFEHLRTTAIAHCLPESGAIDALVAGCGTGKHPLSMATTIADVRVTAIDLSKASLAYATRKAEELGIDNVRFLHADILDLDALEARYDIIESIGVLHHMDDPLAGLRSLKSRLRPGGVIKLGLYSKTARRSIADIRAEVAASGLEPTLHNLRALRERVFNDPAVTWTRYWRDLYSTSEFRDLVWHTQEHQFTIEGLQQLMADAELRFAGFYFPTGQVLEQYRALYPDDPNALDLTNWAAFEEANPNTFRGMYNFHCF